MLKHLPSITVIVPVYGDWPSLEQCIESLKQHVSQPNKVMLVNDCGPEADTIEANIKTTIKGASNFSYFRNKKNLGFVGNCNRAVNVLDKTDNDILLLNSDTRVTEGFLEEMQQILYIENDIGAVSPRSNNATICTVPITSMRQKGIDPDRSFKLFKRLVKKIPRYSIAPTAHGFCMLTRRTLIKKYGLFDTVFGKGYGEEVDFCRRIKEKGWKCALSNHAYVFHLEARSFSMETKTKMLEKNNKIIWSRYPDYQKDVRDYIVAAEIREGQILPRTARYIKETRRKISLLLRKR